MRCTSTEMCIMRCEVEFSFPFLFIVQTDRFHRRLAMLKQRKKRKVKTRMCGKSQIDARKSVDEDDDQTTFENE